MPLTPEELEARIHAVLREQPPRRAPETLAQRVLAEIARREALPWWHKSYAYWPAPVRLAFLVLSLSVVTLLGFAAMLFLRGNSFEASVAGVLEPVWHTVATFRAAGQALLELGRGWLPSVSALWIYVGLGAIGTAYATLVGLGATAYRLLLQPRS